MRSVYLNFERKKMQFLSKNTILLFLVLFLGSCEKEVNFAFDMDDLTGTQWGIPQIIELGPGVVDYELSAPTVFYADGTMSVAGNFDFWSLRSSKTILIEQARELWFIIDLSPTQLMVEKTRFPGGEFLLRSVYYPMEK
jgi:hypothetical protein